MLPSDTPYSLTEEESTAPNMPDLRRLIGAMQRQVETIVRERELTRELQDDMSRRIETISSRREWAHFAVQIGLVVAMGAIIILAAMLVYGPPASTSDPHTAPQTAIIDEDLNAKLSLIRKNIVTLDQAVGELHSNMLNIEKTLTTIRSELNTQKNKTAKNSSKLKSRSQNEQNRSSLKIPNTTTLKTPLSARRPPAPLDPLAFGGPALNDPRLGSHAQDKPSVSGQTINEPRNKPLSDSNILSNAIPTLQPPPEMRRKNFNDKKTHITYIAQAQETLNKIANSNGVSIEEIIKANPEYGLALGMPCRTDPNLTLKNCPLRSGTPFKIPQR